MQLNNKKPQIAAIASSLLSSFNALPAQAEQADWSYDLTGFRYAESDDRVADNSIKFQAARTTESLQVMSFGLSYDSLTGASAGGFVDPGGSGTPVLTPIEDTRIAANASLAQPLGNGLTVTLGGSYSGEDDYLHTGVNGALSKELNDKNTVLNFGYAYSGDTVDGVVGNPVPGSFTNSGFGTIGEQDKSVNDLIFGVTQVINKRAIAQLNYSFSHSSGYLNDPYKVVSVVNGAGIPQRYIYESRPGDRTANGIYGALNYKFDSGVLKPSYRFFSDDWGIQSHTFEMKYGYEIGNKSILEPRIRFYSQSRADFYRGQIGDAERPAQYLSSDYRLDEYTALTLGLQYRFFDSAKREWRIGMDVYNQSPSLNPDQLPGQNDLNPGISAVIVRGGVNF